MKYLLSYSKLFENQEISDYKLKKRWDKKRKAIKELQSNINKLRRKVSSDMGSDDEKKMIISTIVRIMDLTGERVGNDSSGDNGHYGISNLMKKHVNINGDNVKLSYTGKSGVKHTIEIKDSKVARNLKKLMNKHGEIFVTENGLSIKSTQVNRYLKDFNITSKDLRGFKVNKLMSEKLRKLKRPENMGDIKKIFNEVLRNVAEKIGHTPGICRKNYLLPEIEQAWYEGKSIPKI